MIGLGLKLLGISKWIKDFFFANWKWILPIILAVGLWFYHKHEVKQAYKEGVQAERQVWIEKANKENEENRKTERELDQAILDFVTNYVQNDSVRKETEVTHIRNIETIIKNNTKYEDCRADQEVLDEINKIRNLGPGEVK